MKTVSNRWSMISVAPAGAGFLFAMAADIRHVLSFTNKSHGTPSSTLVPPVIALTEPINPAPADVRHPAKRLQVGGAPKAVTF